MLVFMGEDDGVESLLVAGQELGAKATNGSR